MADNTPVRHPRTARQVAVQILDAVLHQGRSLKAELDNRLPSLTDPRERALTEALVMAVLRQRHRYDTALQNWMARPPGARDGKLRALLHIGMAQLDALGLPPHAALSATVETTRLIGRAHQAGLVNAVLRRAQREGIPDAPAESVWPEWLRSEVRRAWPTQADAVFAASAQPAPMWLRVNRRKQSRHDYAEQLTLAGIAHHIPDMLADAICLASPCPVGQLPGFADGQVSIQDGSAQGLADALPELPAHAHVLDACAAPGGKAAHLAERHPDAHILACDIDPRRVRRMQDTFARLGLAIECRCHDGRTLPPAPAQWDAIVLDAPCSASGIIRRQPDVLLHRRASDIDALVRLQAELLDALWLGLKPDGILLYATCSILPRENADQIAAFLARTPDARLEPLDSRFGHDTGHGWQRLPGESDMDGFFYARLRRLPS